MTLRTQLQALFAQEDINFLLTNRLPRMAATRCMGRLARIKAPWFVHPAIALWQWAGGLDLSESRKSSFTSIRDCFIRELRDGVRPVDSDPTTVASPCDGIVGAFGRIERGQALQIKGMQYSIAELLGDPAWADLHEGDWYLTIRITAAMYHRFHAPVDGCIQQVKYISGDTWNVNPIALKRVERLFCRNERAVLRVNTAADEMLSVVPVAAVLVASMRLHCLDVLFHLRYRGPQSVSCQYPIRKGEELGWFEHGSTIVVLAPRRWRVAEGIGEGTPIKMGERLFGR